MEQPTLIPVPFAQNGDKNIIPDATTGSAASWNIGFPPITSLPLGAGGVAPSRNDFNGILNAISAAIVFMQNGGVYLYSDAVDYSSGAIVVDNSGTLYQCVQANGPTSQTRPLSNRAYWQPINELMTGASSSQAGAQGIVPAPAAGKQGSYLMGDGTWGRDADVLAAISAGQIGDAATVNEAADLDEYQTQGTYYFVWHSGNEHFPVEVGGYLIVVTGKGSSLVRQLYMSNHAAKAEIYTRLYNAGTWGDWCKIINHKDTMTGATASQAGAVGLVPAPAAGKQGSYLMGNGTWGRDADVLAAIEAGQIGGAANSTGAVNFNDYTTAGSYYCVWNSGNTNYPVESSGWLIVERGKGATYIKQIFYNLSSGGASTYSRIYNGDSEIWSAWQQESSSLSLSNLQSMIAAGLLSATVLSGTVDLNNYVIQGIYYVNSNSAEHLNLPYYWNGEYISGYLIVLRGGNNGANFVNQIYITSSSFLQVFRRLGVLSKGTWGPWGQFIGGNIVYFNLESGDPDLSRYDPNTMVNTTRFGMSYITAQNEPNLPEKEGGLLEVIGDTQSVAVDGEDEEDIDARKYVFQSYKARNGAFYIRNTISTSGEQNVWTDWVNIGPPYAQTTEGIGQWVSIDVSDGSPFDLPAGGRWEYFLLLFNASTGAFSGKSTGVVAGGAHLFDGSASLRYVGFAKRVA